MDTIPFHCLMFALDVVLWYGLFFWLRPASRRKASAFPYEIPMLQDEPARTEPPGTGTTWLRDLLGTAVLGGIGLAGVAVFAKVFQANFGQCVIEGLAYHGSVFLVVAAVLLSLRRRRKTAATLGLLALLIFGGGFDMLVWEPNHFVVEHYTIETPKVVTPVRLVFAADIQTDKIGDYERKTLDAIRKQDADLIVFGGDYLQFYEGSPRAADLPERFRNLFLDAELTAPLGVYAIGGNIDPMSPKGLRSLFNETTVETVYDSEIIENLGVDKGIGPVDLVLLCVHESMHGDVKERGLTDTGHFIIMAGHYPSYAILDYRNADRAPDLMLAGHTHGGQVALPWIGPLVFWKVDRKGVITRDFFSGMKTFDNGGRLLVSRGTGMERGWAPRVRFFCRPEISVIDIVPKNDETKY